MADSAEPASGPPDLVGDILFRLSREVADRLGGARRIRHPGESGRARENVVADALASFIPDAYGVSTGFVIDGVGGISRQQDIVIYRRGYHPVFRVGGVDHFMVEAVSAVLQNRAAITSRDTLLDALDTIESVKRLDRTNRGTNYVVHGSNRGEAVGRSYRYQVWGAIVTEESLAPSTLGEAMREYLRGRSRTLWTNVYADVNGSAGLFQTAEGGTTDDPDEAVAWLLTNPERDDAGAVPSFAELLGHLANYLRIAPLVDYKPASYLPHYTGEARRWELEPSDGRFEEVARG
jgi:hypothetical protein